jgi:hypothetical protein
LLLWQPADLVVHAHQHVDLELAVRLPFSLRVRLRDGVL